MPASCPSTIGKVDSDCAGIATVTSSGGSVGAGAFPAALFGGVPGVGAAAGAALGAQAATASASRTAADATGRDQALVPRVQGVVGARFIAPVRLWPAPVRVAA